MREVRIRDTLSGETVALERSGEVGIYACGPTVYSRIHIGNARPFVVFSLLARFLRSEGYEAKLVVNVTDVNDKIYEAARAAGEPSAEFAARMTAAYVEDTDRLGLGRPDAEPLATEEIDGIVALIAELVEGGHAYESGGDVYFRVASFEGYGKLSNRRPEDMDQGEEAGRRVAEGEPARLRPLESPEGGRGHRLGLALGPRPPRLAHRVLGDGRARARPLLRDPRRRLGPRLPPPRERDRPVRGGRPRLRPPLDAQRHGRDRRGEDVEVGGQHLPALGGARPLRARGGRPLPGLRALPPAAGVRARGDGAGGGPGASACATSSESTAIGRQGTVPAEQQRGGSGGTVPRRPSRGVQGSTCR